MNHPLSILRLVKPIAGMALVFLLAIAGSPARADILITPGGAGVIEGDFATNNNCEPDCVYTAFGLTNDGTLLLLYKAEVDDGGEEGSFKDSYFTTFSNTTADPSDALIAYIAAQPSISCPECYLAIKDGNHNPEYYFYNLAAWNGTESLDLQDFWPGQGAISHVSIWGREGGGNVPEPATIALVALALFGVAVVRRRA